MTRESVAVMKSEQMQGQILKRDGGEVKKYNKMQLAPKLWIVELLEWPALWNQKENLIQKLQ